MRRGRWRDRRQQVARVGSVAVAFFCVVIPSCCGGAAVALVSSRMTTWQALVLGILQGLAEFLPISSSAHLVLAPWAFGWEDPGLAFDVALHAGSLIALLWYFRDEWARLLKAAGRIVRQGAIRDPEEQRLGYLVIATIPGGSPGCCSRSRRTKSSVRRP